MLAEIAQSTYDYQEYPVVMSAIQPPPSAPLVPLPDPMVVAAWCSS